MLDSNAAAQVKTALSNAGLSDPVLSFALAQCALESAGFTSNVFTSYNNAGGIQYIGQAGATDSGAAKGDGGTFAAYASLDLFAADLIRILNLQRSGNTIGAPIGATSLQGYVDSLQANNYFGNGNPANYLSGLTTYTDTLNALPAGSTAIVNNTLWQTTKTVANLAVNSENILLTAAGGVIVLIALIVIIFSHNKKSKNANHS